MKIPGLFLCLCVRQSRRGDDGIRVAGQGTKKKIAPMAVPTSTVVKDSTSMGMK